MLQCADGGLAALSTAPDGVAPRTQVRGDGQLAQPEANVPNGTESASGAVAMPRDRTSLRL